MTTPVSRDLPGVAFTRWAVTVVLALIGALTFAFGFGSIWALGRSLRRPRRYRIASGPRCRPVGSRATDTAYKLVSAASSHAPC